jgi:hypothetical protein
MRIYPNSLQKIILFASLGIFISCNTVLVSKYVKVENITSLNVGMSKKEVLSNLENVYPTEILNGTGNCEIHEYLYVKPHRSLINITGVLGRDELKSGNEKYISENKAVLVYRDKKLSMVYTNGGAKDLSEILSVQNKVKEKCKNELIITKGCTDPLSINFEPNALEDDGSCEYCDCGMISNPFYNNKRPLSDCNSKCISEDLVDANGELIKKILGNKEKECSKCDLIEALNTSNASITINVNSKKTKNIDNEISVVQKKSHLKKKLSDFFSFKKKKKSTLNITTNSVDNSNENSVTNDN